MEPLFILGAPRSGTTFLAELVGQLEYGTPVETHFIIKYFKNLSSYGDLNIEVNFTRLINDIKEERPIQQWQIPIDAASLFEKLKENKLLTYAVIVNELMMTRSRFMGHTNWGDKTPHYIDNLPILVQLFPQAKYIYIVRDGRDVALSLLKKPWGPNNTLAAAEYWARLNMPSQSIENLKNTELLVQISYEDLVQSPKNTISQIYTHLNENIDDQSLSLLAEKASSSSYFRWKREMTARQIALFEGEAAETLTFFGYQPMSESFSKKTRIRPLYLLHDRFLRIAHMIKQNTVDTILIKYFNKSPFGE